MAEQILTIINAENNDRETALEKQLSLLPEETREAAEKAYRAWLNEDYEIAERRCRRLLQSTSHLEIQLLLGQCYFAQGKWLEASELFGSCWKNIRKKRRSDYILECHIMRLEVLKKQWMSLYATH